MKLLLCRTIILYLCVLFAMRLMGKRQLGELQPSELVTTFMISNVASICIDEPDLPLLSSLVPILLIAALEILNSTAAYYLPGYAALLFGRPVTVIQDGQIRQDALRHLRMTPGDLMEALRGKDIFDPRQVVWGVVEPSGSISAAQKMADDSPLLPLCDVCIRVPLQETYQIQELHLPIYHCLCLMLEEHFFDE